MSPVSTTYWGISGYVIFWVLSAIAVGLFARRAYFLFRLLGLGKAVVGFGSFGYMVKMMLITGFLSMIFPIISTASSFLGIKYRF